KTIIKYKIKIKNILRKRIKKFNKTTTTNTIKLKKYMYIKRRKKNNTRTQKLRTITSKIQNE
ncbi:hypothetical protein, partial [Enterococcus faecium]|uniref:hypothetical protein n=1 Tax=Enterococcus faecium TaxID=1352 RepID=UPI003F43F23C